MRFDEEHPLGARITLEEGGTVAPWAITCGIYGWMVHTVFCASEEEARAKMYQMKAQLETILHAIPMKEAADLEIARSNIVKAIEKLVNEF